MPKLPQLEVGSTFNSLTLVSFLPKSGRHLMGLWRCTCGNEKAIRLNRVDRGETKACGCEVGKALTASVKTHGMAKTREFHIWNNMKYRCETATSKDYPKYGGVGITFCERWRSFENFLEDMGLCPSKDHSLDRIDTFGNYCPENCRWADRETQMNNRRATIKLEYEGKLYSRSQFARLLGVKWERVMYISRTHKTAESIIQKLKEANDLR